MAILDLKPHIGLPPVWDDNPFAIPPPVLALILNEGSGDIAFDLSGNDVTSIFGAGAAAPSWGGGHLAFSGDDYVDTQVTELNGTSLFCEATQQFTVGVRFNTPATTGIGSLIGKAGGGGANRTFQMHIIGEDLQCYLRGADTIFATGVRDSVSHVVYITWDGTTARSYIDGEFSTNLNVGAAAEETTQRIILGARTNGTGYFLVGSLHDAIIYSKALTPAQIAFISANPYYAWDYLQDITAIIAAQEVAAAGIGNPLINSGLVNRGLINAGLVN